MYKEDISFEYYLGHGCHNNFIIIDNTQQQYILDDIYKSAHQLLLESKRDDLLIINYLSRSKDCLILEMKILEPNGCFADFCGNGARLVGEFIFKNHLHELPYFFLRSRVGLHRISLLPDGRISVEMPPSNFTVDKTKFIAVSSSFNNNVIICGIEGETRCMYYVESVEPHLIVFDNLSTAELITIGEYVNYKLQNVFPYGVHVNSCKVVCKGRIFVQTYERALFRVTASCGTGAISSSQMYNRLNGYSDRVLVHTRGGDIHISGNTQHGTILMSGKAVITSGPRLYINKSKIHA